MEESQISGVVINVLRPTDNDIEFLFLLRSGGIFKGQWWPVTGTSKVNESPIQTALRELNEETNLTPERIYLLGKKIEHMDKTSKLEAYVAFAQSNSAVVLNYEHSEYKWLKLKEVLQILPKSTQPVIEYIYANFVAQTPPKELLAWAAERE